LGREKKWYAHFVGGVNGNWDELRDNFCLAFFSLFRIADLRIEILTFKQREKETLGAAWARFTSLSDSGPNLSLSSHVLYYHFYRGLNKEAALYLDIASGGSFTHKLTDEGRAILERILEKLLTQAFMMSFLKKKKKSSLILNQKIRNLQPS